MNAVHEYWLKEIKCKSRQKENKLLDLEVLISPEHKSCQRNMPSTSADMCNYTRGNCQYVSRDTHSHQTTDMDTVLAENGQNQFHHQANTSTSHRFIHQSNNNDEINKSASKQLGQCRNDSFFKNDTSPLQEATSSNQRETTPICNKNDRESKRKRIKRMISRRLRRSKSDSCDKGRPVHALFFGTDSLRCEDTMENRAKDLSSFCHRLIERNDVQQHHKEEFKFHKSYSVDSPRLFLDPGKQSKPKSANCIIKGLKKRFSFLRRRNTDTSLISNVCLSLELPAPTHEQVYQWSCSFDSLLHDKNGQEIFKSFLKSEFSEDNLEFWIACELYKSCNDKKRTEAAQRICEDFLVEQAPKEVSLDFNTKSATINHLDHPSNNMFDHAQRRIQILMEKDSYARFIESDLYLHLLRSLAKT